MRSVVSLFLLATVGCAPAADWTPSFSETDEASIRETYRAYSAAQETAEVSQLGRFFTEDALWIQGTAGSVRGREEIQAWFTVRAMNSAIEIQEVRGAGEPSPCNMLTVWEKQTDGAWLIARYLSVCQPQP